MIELSIHAQAGLGVVVIAVVGLLVDFWYTGIDWEQGEKK